MNKSAWWILPLAASLSSCQSGPLPPVAADAPYDPIAEHPFDEASDEDGNTYGILAVGDLTVVGTAVDSQVAGMPKERLVDRVLSTAWSNGGYRNATSWASVQLAATTSLASVSLKTGPSAPGTSYDIQVSADGSSWTTVLANQANTTWNMERKALPAGTSGRHVRIYWRNSTSNPQPHFSIFELAVQGETGSGPAPTPVPTVAPSSAPTAAPTTAPTTAPGGSSAYYPDLAAVAPNAYYLERDGGKHYIRFSTAMANVGRGHLQVRGRIEGDRTRATQEILDANGRVVETKDVGFFELHPDHGHFHVDNVSRYELREGSSSGPTLRRATKVSFCMEDSYRYLPNSGSSRFPDCTRSMMGVSRGFADLYSANLPDQRLELTGLPAGEYTVHIRLDPTNKFLEASRENNTAWLRFRYDPRAASISRVASYP